MEIVERVVNGVSVMAVSGKIDSFTSEKVHNALLAQVNRGAAKIVADLEGVDYTSSAGIRSLLAILKAARRKNGDLRLACVQPYVLKVLEMSGFTSLFQMYDDVGTAVASFQS